MINLDSLRQGKGSVAQDLAVGIVNFNRSDFLTRCLESVVADAPSGLEIIVVDNASTDDSLAAVRSSYCGVQLIANEQNRGYARAVNQLLAYCSKPYLLVLNNDVEVLPGALEELLTFAKAHPDGGAIGPMLLKSEGSPHRLPASLFSRLAWEPNYSSQVAWLVGAALFLKRQALEAIGGFDESYFFYYEDWDLGLRLKKAGWKSYYAPAARMIHHEKASTAAVRPEALYHLYRGRLLLARKHFAYAFPLTKLWLRATFELWLLWSRFVAGDGALEAKSREIRALLRQGLD